MCTFHVTKLQHKHPLSIGAPFKVMLHNSKSQRGATSHCISVLKQSETAASRWITREDNKKNTAYIPFFFNIPLQMRFIMFHIHCWQKEMTLLPSS